MTHVDRPGGYLGRAGGVGTLPAVSRRTLRATALAVGVLLLAGCAGGERPEMGEVPAGEQGELRIRHLDPELTYVARAGTDVQVFADPTDAEPSRTVTPPTAEAPSGGLAIDGFIVQAPYEAEPDFHEIALANGTTGWVRTGDVRVEQVSVVAMGNGTEVDPSGGGGGTVDVYAEPDASQPVTTIENPKSAEGLNVGPVVFLANGPVDPNADWINVLLPVRPNGSDGWVRRSDVTLTANQFHIEVRLSAHQLRVFDGTEQVMQAPIEMCIRDRR